MAYEKKYNEALERAKKWEREHPHGYVIKDMMEYIFPELRESEDERIRKWIIGYAKGQIDGFSLVDDEECNKIAGQWRKAIAWLEKQKERKPHLELKAGKWYICHRAFCARADHLTVKEGERFQCEKDGIVKGFVIKEPEKYFKECGAPAPMEDEQQEQKPEERFEEARKKYQVEWSEEDEKMLRATLTSLREYQLLRPNFQVELQMRWLNKSLRPQYHGDVTMTEAYKMGLEAGKASFWKPSKEQMDSLRDTIVQTKGYSYSVYLPELYEHLKGIYNNGKD